MIRIIKYFVRLVSCIFFRAKKLKTNEMREIWRRAKVCCIICDAGIGDSLMATPLIGAIKHRKPFVRLIVVGKENIVQVSNQNPNVDTIMKYSLKPHALSFIILLWRLRQEHIDVLIAAQPSNTILHSLIAACSRSKILLKHTYDYKNFLERDFSFVYSTLLQDNMERHRIELNLDFLRFLGEDIRERSMFPKFYISNDAREKVEMWFKSVGKNGHSDKLIAMHPGGVRQNKRWIPERFAKVSKELMRSGFTICFVGGSDEKNLSAEIAQEIGMDGLLNVTGIFSLDQTAALLKRCRFLISNDTGIMHLATAVGTPVIAIFGPTNFRHIGPFSQSARIVFTSSNIQETRTEDVLNAVWEVINTKFAC